MLARNRFHGMTLACQSALVEQIEYADKIGLDLDCCRPALYIA